MEVEGLAEFVRYLKDEQEHVCALIEGRRGKGKSITSWNLAVQLRKHGIDAAYVNRPEHVGICEFLVLDDFGKILYLRDFGKTSNKKAVKSIQSIRGAIPFLMITVPSISRLDKDFREFFGVHGAIIDFGWMEIEGVVIGPIEAHSLPPSDLEQREEHFLDAMHKLKF